MIVVLSEKNLIKIKNILIAKWDNELIVFNPNSGDTHLFPVEISPIIQYCLERDQIFFSELLYFIKTLNGTENFLEDSVKQLINIGFLQPADSD